MRKLQNLIGTTMLLPTQTRAISAARQWWPCFHAASTRATASLTLQQLLNIKSYGRRALRFRRKAKSHVKLLNRRACLSPCHDASFTLRDATLAREARHAVGGDRRQLAVLPRDFG